MNIKSFTFNPFQENTYLIWDEEKTAAVIDAGCFTAAEQATLQAFIAANGLNIRYLLTTHGHIDHILGNAFVMDTYAPDFISGTGVAREIADAQQRGRMFGIEVGETPQPTTFVKHGDEIAIGTLRLQVLFTPGHSAGHLSFFDAESRSLFSGDVLFYGSIGRTDLPGGNHAELIETIHTLILPLGDEVRVYSGHGQPTTIGRERVSNPFL